MTRTRTQERVWTSVALAVVVHAAAFVALQLFLQLRSERLPEYSGPLFVQLEEQPVIQQSRQPAPQALEASAAAPAAAAEAPAPAAPAAPAPAGPALRTAEASPPKPSGSPFRMEGAAAQEAQAPAPGPLRPAGEGFQTASEQPTLPAAGVKAEGAPLRAEAAAPARQGGPALPLESVDQALAGPAARPAAGSAAAKTTGERSAAGSGDLSREGVSILWEDPAQGREPSFMPKPAIPGWVSQAGLTLTIEVSFVLTPQGVMRSVRVGKSSGYSDVDTSVLEALRRWKFKPVAGRTDVNGRVGYLILPR